VVIFWYGGSWTSGSKADYRFVGTALAGSGCVAVLPDYRLYPAVTFPAFVEDGARAVAWVERHAEELGGDHTRIVLMGHSAGAHEAAMLALQPRYLERAGATPADIVGLVGLSGPYALAPDTPVLNTIFAAPYQPSDWQPLQYASSRAPPTLLLHGLEDQRVDPMQARQLRDALAAQGVRVELELYEGQDHAAPVVGFTVFERKRVPTLERAVRFIRSVAGPKAAP
jgi:acetyl esterase/lipase